MVKYFFLIGILFSTLSSFGQKNGEVSLLGSYQFYDQQLMAFGGEYSHKGKWPKLNFDYRYQLSARGLLFLDQANTAGGKYYGVREEVYICTKFVGLGFQNRILFQGMRQRYEIGPSVKLGCKWIWLEYTMSFEVANNPWSHHRELSPMEFEKGLHNLNVRLSIPIFKIKE